MHRPFWFIIAVSFVVCCCFGFFVGRAAAERNSPSNGYKSLSIGKRYCGELVKIKGKTWILRQRTGEEIVFYVDGKTRKMGSRPAIGARVEVYLSASGHAESIELQR